MTFTGADADLDRLPGIAWGVTARDRAFADPAGRRPRRRAGVDRRGRPAALPRGPRARRQPPGHPGQRGRRTCCARPASSSPGGCSSPLLHAALDNALRLGDAALTGPVSRGDAGTVGKHLDRHRRRESVPAYLALARRTADRADRRRAGCAPQDAGVLLTRTSWRRPAKPAVTGAPSAA